MSEDTPSWLTANEDAPSAATTTPMPTPFAVQPLSDVADTPDINASASMLKSSGAAKRKNAAKPQPEVDETELPRIILIMRLANMGVVVALITFSILEMVSLPSPAHWVLSIYATCGGLLVCCLETQLKFVRVRIALNFGFLFSPFLRFFFYILMASISWSFENVLTQIVSMALIVVALFNTYVLCRYPSYRAIRERLAAEEDTKIEARISGEVKKQAIRSLTS